MTELIINIAPEKEQLVKMLVKELGGEVIEEKKRKKPKASVSKKSSRKTPKKMKEVSPSFLFGKWKDLDIDAKTERRSMGQKPQILVDTDILIKVYRGHQEHNSVFKKEKGNLAVSSITYLELLYGLKTRRRIIDLHKQMKAFSVIQLSESISLKAVETVNKYGVSHSMKPADALIAATALVTDLQLFTDNQQDFNFIHEIRFYK